MAIKVASFKALSELKPTGGCLEGKPVDYSLSPGQAKALAAALKALPAMEKTVDHGIVALEKLVTGAARDDAALREDVDLVGGRAQTIVAARTQERTQCEQRADPHHVR